MHEDFGTLVLDVSLGRRQERADGVDGDARLDEGRAGLLQLVKTVVVGCVHHA